MDCLRYLDSFLAWLGRTGSRKEPLKVLKLFYFQRLLRFYIKHLTFWGINRWFSANCSYSTQSIFVHCRNPTNSRQRPVHPCSSIFCRYISTNSCGRTVDFFLRKFFFTWISLMNIELWNCFRFNRIKQVFFKTINKRCQQKILKTRQRFAPPPTLAYPTML